MPINKVFHVENEAGLAAIAAELAPLFAGGAIVALEGNLGAGKTALSRALIREITGNPALDVPSPTFTLVQTYDAPPGKMGGEIWHFDFYRLKHPEEVFELGWEDALAGGGLLLMEWAERIGPLLPQMRTTITITPQDNGTRTIEVRG
jgi:tRNA threonylcarbamoyl adenosine modification protein YjeE